MSCVALRSGFKSKLVFAWLLVINENVQLFSFFFVCFFLFVFPIYTLPMSKVKDKPSFTLTVRVSFITNKCGDLKHPWCSILVLMNR